MSETQVEIHNSSARDLSAKDILVVWAQSYGKILNISNLLAQSNALVLDCAVIGKWSQAILDISKVSESGKVLLNSLENHKELKVRFLKKMNPEVLNSYLSLSSEKIEDFLFVLEMEFLGDAFYFAQELYQQKLKIVDFRLLRFSNPKVILMFTGSKEIKDKASIMAENFLAQKKESMEMSLIYPIDTQIKNLFQLD